VSRIHDALRRERGSGASPAPRPAHADTVLTALGYRHAKPGAGRRLLVAGALLGIAGAAGWALWKAEPKTQVRPAAENRVPIVGGLAGGMVPSRLPARPALPAASIPAPKPQLATAPVLTQAAPQAQPPAVPRPAPKPLPSRPARRPSTVDPRPSSALVRDEFQLALYYQRAGDFEQALLHYKAAIQRDEMNVEAHNNLGSLYLGRNLLDESAREFQRVLAIDPRYLPAHVNLSATLYKLGRFDAAAAQAREALRIDPRNVDGFVNLALAQKSSGQHAESQDSLRRALELDPRHPGAHYNLARQYEDGGETVRAVEHYRQFLQYSGPEQEAYAVDVRARLRTLQGRGIR